jgi:hypothetical protein
MASPYSPTEHNNLRVSGGAIGASGRLIESKSRLVSSNARVQIGKAM